MGIEIFLIVCVAALIFLLYALFQLIEDPKRQRLAHHELVRDGTSSSIAGAKNRPAEKIVAFRQSPAQRQSG